MYMRKVSHFASPSLDSRRPCAVMRSTGISSVSLRTPSDLSSTTRIRKSAQLTESLTSSTSYSRCGIRCPTYIRSAYRFSSLTVRWPGELILSIELYRERPRASGVISGSCKKKNYKRSLIFIAQSPIKRSAPSLASRYLRIMKNREKPVTVSCDGGFIALHSPKDQNHPSFAMRHLRTASES